MEISKADWKLFQERLPKWQEAYMGKLIAGYAEFLSSGEKASTLFWGLEKKIRQDKKSPGVQLWLDKKNVDFDLLKLMGEGVIAAADLDGFSEELKERVLYLYKEHYQND